jgi:hypothetical protein
MSGSQQPLNGADSEPIVTPVQKAYNIIHALDERLESEIELEDEWLREDIGDILNELHEAELVLEDANLAAHEQSEWKRVETLDTMGADL